MALGKKFLSRVCVNLRIVRVITKLQWKNFQAEFTPPAMKSDPDRLFRFARICFRLDALIWAWMEENVFLRMGRYTE